MNDPDLDEAYSFSSYGSGARPFALDGETRGNHWMEGPADGARVYVCDVTVAGKLPALVVRRRGLASLRADTSLPRVRSGDEAVDGAVACYTRAAELPRQLLAQPYAQSALLTEGLRLTVEAGAEQSRVTIERELGADRVNIGLPEQSREPDTQYVGVVTHVPSRTAAAAAGAIRAARTLVRAFDELASRNVTWSEAALFEADTLDDAALARLLDTVLSASSWLSGHAARVGNGVEARLSLPFGADELKGVLSVTPVAERALSVRFEGALPETTGGALRLSPEKGWRAMLRALVEHEVGSPRLDDALLIEGDKARLDEVRAAAVSFGELAELAPHVTIAHTELVVELPEVPFDGRVTDTLAACLEAWELLRRFRLGGARG